MELRKEEQAGNKLFKVIFMELGINSMARSVYWNDLLEYLSFQLAYTHEWRALPMVYPFTTDWMFVSPPKFTCWNLIPKVIVFGDGVYERWLGHKHGVFMDGISALIKETSKSSLPLPPCEGTVRKQPSTNQEPGPDQTPNLPMPSSSWTSPPPELWVVNVCCLSHQAMVYSYKSLN